MAITRRKLHASEDTSSLAHEDEVDESKTKRIPLKRKLSAGFFFFLSAFIVLVSANELHLQVFAILNSLFSRQQASKFCESPILPSQIRIILLLLKNMGYTLVTKNEQ